MKYWKKDVEDSYTVHGFPRNNCSFASGNIMRHMGIFMKRLAVMVLSAVILGGLSAWGDMYVTDEWLKDDYTKDEMMIPNVECGKLL